MPNNYTEISPSVFTEMVIAAYKILDAEKDYINSLNVFPVPDGDTGTNMFLTMKAAADAIKNTSCNKISELSELVANECLLGARGNSGMILANFFKGFAKALKLIDNLNINNLAKAIREGAVSAYKAVRNPVEGTILTVMNAIAKKVKEFSPKESLSSFFEKILETAEQVQKLTPELLPQLKRAGVVDAGGQGFVSILRAFTYVIKGKKIEYTKKDKVNLNLDNSFFSESLNYNYSLEFFIEGENIEIDKLGYILSKMGNSLVMSRTENRIRVHIHTNIPEKIKETASSIGKLNLICEDNMLAQYKSFFGQKEIGIIAISPGEGFSNIFLENGADSVITYSKSKPSVKELITACEGINFQSIIILPNDKDILPTALKASELVSKNVKVLQTKSVPEGMASLISFDPENSMEDNLKLMEEISQKVKSGKIAQAIRHSKTEEFLIKKRDYIGIQGDEIKIKAKNLMKALLKLLEEIVKSEDEVIMIYYGKDVKEKELEEIKNLISENFKDKEIQWYYGGQLYYDFIVGVY